MTEPGMLAAYDQDKANVAEMIREAVWVYRQSVIDEGGELPAIAYMTTNYAKSIARAHDGDLDLAVIQLSCYISFAIQLLSEHIGEVE